ncbi:NAD(P)H:quinone oxidoreductase [alpha proteobacterium AAP81b]|nr:NAD(P)H:quinone oxidoreductase [alpha proteobacterium AAP81b]
MARVLVLYYSSHGEIEGLAQAAAEGARAAGAEAIVKRVPETFPRARAVHFKRDQAAPIACPTELASYDAIIVGAPPRYGRMASPMAVFLDQTGGRWALGAFTGKVGGAFTSSATLHGGSETTLQSIVTNLLHFGMIVVGRPYRAGGWSRVEALPAGAAAGAAAVAPLPGERQPGARDLDGVRTLGERVATTAAKLFD